MTDSGESSGNQTPRLVEGLSLRACIGVSGMIVSASRSWRSLLGWNRADLAQGAFVERVHPDDVDTVVGAIHRVYYSGASADFMCRYARKAGGYALVAWQAIPRRDVQFIDLQGKVTSSQ